ncbi:MAG: DNA gyrase inhibitor YacG [Pseudomonadota bacterium]|nr:DNA gyrase inhibitor YacG [Pseudomonadota bacterium]
MSQPKRASPVIRCPGCGGPSVYAPTNVWRPFCSIRCQTQDLGAWASGGYAVAADPDPESSETDDPKPTAH